MTSFAPTTLSEGRSWLLLHSLWPHHLLALLFRLSLIVYGEHYDATSSVHYTDVDYHVLTDAARHVSVGGSPFERHTYRYTPLLAWLMLPNVLWHPAIGKLFFCFLDGAAASLIYHSLLLKGVGQLSAVKCALLWLYNPIVIGISTRGSAESVVVTFVLLIIYFHEQSKIVLSGIFLGAAVHFKMYPIIYSLPLYLSLDKRCGKYSWQMFYPSQARVKLVIAAVSSFLLLTYGSYALYGFDYIQEGFIYHVTRVDTRHNFSIYFYLLYLSTDYNIPGLGLATFAPQFVLLVAYGLVYGTREHLLVAMFAQTVSLVAFNKVVTSQYFVWYLGLLPLVVPNLGLSRRKAVILATLWLLAQAAWLLPAYLFEFKGIGVFVPIWLESIAFFCCNVGVLMAILSSYWERRAALYPTKEKLQ